MCQKKKTLLSVIYKFLKNMVFFYRNSKQSPWYLSVNGSHSIFPSSSSKMCLGFLNCPNSPCAAEKEVENLDSKSVSC